MQLSSAFGYIGDARPVSYTAGGAIVFADFKQQLAESYCALQKKLFAAPAPNPAVAIYSSDSYEFSLLLFAALACGARVVIPANNKRATVQALRDVTLWLGEWDLASALGVKDLREPSAEVALPQIFSGSVELFTSGSSGEPQRVNKSLAQLYRELAAQQQHWGAAIADATVLATVSHQHIYGLLFKVLWPLASGRAFVSKTYVDVAALLRDATQLAPAIWVASPAQLSRRIESWPWESGTALRAIFSSGGPLALVDASQVQALCGLGPIEIYGSTETGGIAWRQQQNDARWQPLSQVEVEAVDGLLCVRSPWLGEPSFLGQDRVQISDDGKTFQLLGRADNLVKIEEKRISLTQIEKLLENSVHIHQTKVLGVKRGRDCVAAIAVLSDSGQQALEEQGKAALVRGLRKLLAPDLDGVALPRIWRFVRELPTNQQGKSPRESLIHLLDAPPAQMLPRVESVEVAGNQAKARLQVPADLACLPGHFASAPVVPGVVQIDWAMHYGRELLGISGRFASMEVIKFKQLLVPGERATLELEFITEKNKLKFRFASEPGAKEPGKKSREYSSGQLCFEDE